MRGIEERSEMKSSAVWSANNSRAFPHASSGVSQLVFGSKIAQHSEVLAKLSSHSMIPPAAALRCCCRPPPPLVKRARAPHSALSCGRSSYRLVVGVQHAAGAWGFVASATLGSSQTSTGTNCTVEHLEAHFQENRTVRVWRVGSPRSLSWPTASCRPL